MATTRARLIFFFIGQLQRSAEKPVTSQKSAALSTTEKGVLPFNRLETFHSWLIVCMARSGRNPNFLFALSADIEFLSTSKRNSLLMGKLGHEPAEGVAGSCAKGLQ
jgi:hypothetical protein